MCDTPQSQNTCRSFSPERAKDYRQGWSAAEPLQETRHNKKSRRADGKTMWRIGLTVRHTPAIVFVHRFVI